MSSTQANTKLRDSILEYWFGTEPFDDAVYLRRGAMWFNGSPAVDLEITHRFSDALERAAAGELSSWAQTPQGALAWTILVDQFPRHIHRGTAQAYAYGEIGRQWCLRALEAEVHRRIGRVERTFLYLPLQHSEEMADQHRCVALYEELLEQTPADHWFHPHAQHGVDMAKLHARLIQRYGRFPHRNAVLGRASTMFEHMYLQAGGSDFGQRKVEEPPPVSELGAKLVSFRESLDAADVLFVDGHRSGFRSLSHWPGAAVPPGLAHPSSTGMALRLVAMGPDEQRERVGSYARITNDHYDTDGVLAACVLLRPELAMRHEDLLLRTAATGDFRTWNGPDALALELTVWALRDSPRSPLAPALAGLGDDAAARDELAHRYCIDHFGDLLDDPFRFRALWDDEHRRIVAEVERVEARDGIEVTTHAELGLAVVRLERPLGRIALTHAAGELDRVLVVATGEGGTRCRFLYRNESWFLVSRDRVPPRVALEPAAEALAAVERERDGGRWWCTSIDEPSAQLGFGDPSSAAHVFGDVRPDRDPPSSLSVDEIVEVLARTLVPAGERPR